MLLTEHEKYHKLSPKDLKWAGDQVGSIEISKQTDPTGEHFIVSVPVLKTDTRDEFNDRMNFYLSLLQDRMEDGNKAVARASRKNVRAKLKVIGDKIAVYEKKGQFPPKDLLKQRDTLEVHMAEWPEEESESN